LIDKNDKKPTIWTQVDEVKIELDEIKEIEDSYETI
jgi:hypothetical protein